MKKQKKKSGESSITIGPDKISRLTIERVGVSSYRVTYDCISFVLIGAGDVTGFLLTILKGQGDWIYSLSPKLVATHSEAQVFVSIGDQSKLIAREKVRFFTNES